MATTTTNFGWDIPQSTDLVKDGATAIAALGQDIDTALVDLKGGTTGQVLAKASNTDLDYSWVAQDDSNAIQNAIVDAKGDLIAATAADTPARLAVGTNGHILTADSTTATGIKWAAPAASASGLTLISATAVSAASAVNIDGCFTSTYTNYRIIYSGTSNAGYTNVALLYRTSGTTDSNAKYEGYVTRYNSASTTTQLYAYQNGTTGHEIVTAGNGMCFVADVFSPQVTEYTSILSNGVGGQVAEGRAIRTDGYGFFENTTAFDGFRLNAGSDTMTGTVFVYGYQKS